MRIFFVIALFIGLLSAASNKSVPVRNGADAPEIELKSPDGKVLKLSKLKGKMVLIDFWASWCGPCRRENPNVVEAYEKYHKAKFKDAKGFEVFSVSLDRNEEAWKKAIDADGLDWKYHVYDKDHVAMTDYGVSSIPMAFLVDADGKIVASGSELRGLGLHLKLDEHIKL